MHIFRLLIICSICLLGTHYSMAQVQPPIIQLPKVQAAIDSLYLLQSRAQRAIAIAAADSARKYQKTNYQTLLQQHQRVLKDIFKEVGFPDEAKVGVGGSSRYTLMVARCSLQPKFQEAVLKRMKPLLGRGADPAAYAVLTDLIEIAAGRAQIYGTQLGYEGDEVGRRVRRPLADPTKADKRRSDIGLPPLADYLATQNKGRKPSNRQSKKEN